MFFSTRRKKEKEKKKRERKDRKDREKLFPSTDNASLGLLADEEGRKTDEALVRSLARSPHVAESTCTKFPPTSRLRGRSGQLVVRPTDRRRFRVRWREHDRCPSARLIPSRIPTERAAETRSPLQKPPLRFSPALFLCFPQSLNSLVDKPRSLAASLASASTSPM